MKLPNHELQLLRNKFLHGSDIEWSEHLEELRECYDTDNEDIYDALVRTGCLNPQPDDLI
jgi:hypothetical protein